MTTSKTSSSKQLTWCRGTNTSCTNFLHHEENRSVARELRSGSGQHPVVEERQQSSRQGEYISFSNTYDGFISLFIYFIFIYFIGYFILFLFILFYFYSYYFILIILFYLFYFIIYIFYYIYLFYWIYLFRLSFVCRSLLYAKHLYPTPMAYTIITKHLYPTPIPSITL